MTTDSGPPPGSDDVLADGEAAPRDRRRALVAGAALAAGALAVCGVLLLGGAGAEDELALGLPPGAPVAPAASPSVAATPSPAADQDAGAAARNPFRALYVEPVTRATATAGADGAAPGGATGEAPPSGTTVPGGPSATPSASAARALLLTGVQGTGDARRASFTVDADTTVVAVGDAFGPSGELTLLSLTEGPGSGAWTAKVQVRTGQPFDVVSGRPTALS